MVLYTVYKASFRTKRNTKRCYVGYTGDTPRREYALKKPGPYQPVWCQAVCDSLDFEELAVNIPSKTAAKALEALLAAKEIARAPLSSRGGPWTWLRLSAQDRQEVKAVAACQSLKELFAVSPDFPGGHLQQHLQDLRFCCPSKAQSSGSRSRAAMPAVLTTCRKQFGQVLKGRSGTRVSGATGHEARCARGLKYGSQEFALAKWGAKPKEARVRHGRSRGPKPSLPAPHARRGGSANSRP
jgi:hypothetical protein